MNEMKSDVELIEKVLHGDQKAFRSLVNKYKQVVFSVILSKTCNETEAEDLTQETLIKAYLNLESLKDRTKFRTWLLTIAQNVAYNWLERHRIHESLEHLIEQNDSKQIPLQLCVKMEAEDELQEEQMRQFLWKGIYTHYLLTARENIGFGKVEELDNMSRIISASQKSGAHEFIKNLPKGYDNMLGKRFEQGEELSIGQWQKVALARAFMRDASVLVLDEPTASFDPEAEYEVFKQFVQLTRDKMTILISHRFSTVRMADRIVVLDKGKIIEQGKHQELIAQNGLYAQLFNMQAEGYR